MNKLKELNNQWLSGEIDFSTFENALIEYYGLEVYNKCIHFCINFMSADLYEQFHQK